MNPLRRLLPCAAALLFFFSTGCQPFSAQSFVVATPPPPDLASPTFAAQSVQVTPTDAATAAPSLPLSKGGFDYYVLALSWAPQYCAANPDDTQECSLGKKYGFVLHGLWPQYTKGYPSDCSNDPLPASVEKKFAGLYPSDKLFEHEWSKHGTCSGLSPADYLTLTAGLKKSVQIPAAYQSPASPFRATTSGLEDAFLQVNPAFSASSLEVNCTSSGRYLSELYACFSLDGQPAACGADVHKTALKSCSQSDFLVRSTK